MSPSLSPRGGGGPLVCTWELQPLGDLAGVRSRPLRGLAVGRGGGRSVLSAPLRLRGGASVLWGGGHAAGPPRWRTGGTV